MLWHQGCKMTDILDHTKDYLEKYQVRGKVLCALSGGCDSVVLAHILKVLGLDIVAIHLNHNWRGDESKRDEEFAREFSKKIGIEFYSEELDSSVKKTELDARDARYDFFRRAANRFGSEFVFLAHNKNDNAETVLYRAIKGTGLKGLCAIPEKREVFCRPLLGVLRDEIEEYARINGLEWIEDSSNNDIKYSRNLIRKEIFPQAKKINPEVINALCGLSKISKMQYKIIEDALDSAKKTVFSGENIILKNFLALSEALKFEVINDFVGSDLKYRDFERIKSYVDFICTKKGRKSLNSELFLEVSGGLIYKTTAKSHKQEAIEISTPGNYGIFGKMVEIMPVSDISNFCPPDGTKFLNLDLKSGIVLRTRREGDIFSPFGMSGTMKLKDYFINQKISRQQRDNLLLLAHKNEILCILGIQISAKVAVSSKNCYRVRILEN